MMRKGARQRRVRDVRKQRKKIEASKKIIIVNYFIFIGVVIATFTALFKGFDISSIVTFDLGVLGLITTWNGFYAWKARSENLLRITKAYEMDEEVIEKLLIDAAKEVINYGEGENIY